MSKQIWISDEAFAYLKSIQSKIKAEQDLEVPLSQLLNKAILNNVKE